MARTHCDGLGGVASLVRAGLTDERFGGIDAIRAQFDAAVALVLEAAVALYSLGSPEILERATAEIVARLSEWRLARRGHRRSGYRMRHRPDRARAGALRGLDYRDDLSPAMIAEARVRCRGLGNVAFACADGSDLAAFAERRFGLVLAVDAFPYPSRPLPASRRGISRIGGAAGAGRRARRSSTIPIAAISTPTAPMSRNWQPEHGFALERNGTCDFALWDGATFLLRKGRERL